MRTKYISKGDWFDKGTEVKLPDPPCRSGVAIKDPLRGLPHYVCDYRARSFPLSNGGVLCLCPEDVTKLTK